LFHSDKKQIILGFCVKDIRQALQTVTVHDGVAMYILKEDFKAVPKLRLLIRKSAFKGQTETVLRHAIAAEEKEYLAYGDLPTMQGNDVLDGFIMSTEVAQLPRTFRHFNAAEVDIIAERGMLEFQPRNSRSKNLSSSFQLRPTCEGCISNQPNQLAHTCMANDADNKSTTKQQWTLDVKMLMTTTKSHRISTIVSFYGNQKVFCLEYLISGARGHVRYFLECLSTRRMLDDDDDDDNDGKNGSGGGGGGGGGDDTSKVSGKTRTALLEEIEALKRQSLASTQPKKKATVKNKTKKAAAAKKDQKIKKVKPSLKRKRVETVDASTTSDANTIYDDLSDAKDDQLVADMIDDEDAADEHMAEIDATIDGDSIEVDYGDEPLI
jgi:hypothetical protein